MPCEILSSITQIGPDEWNSIVGRDRLICRHEYLQAIENSKINDCQYFYPVIRDESGRLLAHTCLYFISTELDLFAKGALKRGIQLIRKLWGSFLILRSVECGTPVALGSTISYADGPREDVLRELVRVAENVAAELGVKVLIFRDFCDDELAFYDRFSALGYKRIHNLASARVACADYDSFSGYVRSMRSRYRRKIQRQMALFRDQGGSVEILSEFGDHVPLLARLWLNAFAHASEYKREILRDQFFDAINRCLGERSVVVLLKVDGIPSGFALVLLDDSVMIPLFCGLDYTVSRSSASYFNLLYEVIKLAIELKMQAVDFGITTLEPKLQMGGEAMSQYMYMKHTNTLLNKVVPRLFDAMTPQPGVRSRNVFRNDT